MSLIPIVGLEDYFDSRVPDVIELDAGAVKGSLHTDTSSFEVSLGSIAGHLHLFQRNYRLVTEAIVFRLNLAAMFGNVRKSVQCGWLKTRQGQRHQKNC